MTLTINKTIVIGLGYSGHQIAVLYQEQIRQQHPNLPFPPIVQLLTLVEEALDGGVNTLAMPLSGGQPLNEFLTNMGLPREISFETLPVRAKGQYALQLYADEIAEQVQQMYDNLRSQETQDVLSQSGMQAADEGHGRKEEVDVFFLASLSDGMVTGILPDLIFLTRDVLMRVTGYAADQFINIHPILLLPGFRGEVVSKAQGATQRAEEQTAGYVQAVACLEEIASLCTAERRYFRKFSEYLTVYHQGNPLGTGNVYLLEPVNEKQNRIDSVAQAELMAATWLYQVTFTPFRKLLARQTLSLTRPQFTFASLGISSLVVPLGLWQTRLSLELERRLIRALLYRQDGMPINLETERYEVNLSQDQLHEQITQGTTFNTLSVATAIGNKNWFSRPLWLIKTAVREYTELLVKGVLPLRAEMLQRVRELTESSGAALAPLIKRLEDRFVYIIATRGLQQTYQISEMLSQALRTERGDEAAPQGSSLLAQAKELEVASRTGNSADIKASEYARQVEVVGSIGGIPLVFVLLLLIAGGAAGLLLAGQGSRLLLIGLGVVIAITGLGTLSGILVQLTAARRALIKAHEARLRAWKDLHLIKARLQLYERTLFWLEAMRQSLQELVEHLQQIDRALISEMKQKGVNEINNLCGTLSNGVSESLLSPQLVKAVEREIISEDLGVELAELEKAIGSPSAWLQDQWGQTELAAALHKFCSELIARRLAQYDLTYVLQLIEDDRNAVQDLAARIRRIGEISQPYWQYDPTQAEESELELLQVAGIARLERNAPWLAHLGGEFEHFALTDPFSFVVGTARFGFLLEEMNTFTHLLLPAYLSAKPAHDIHVIPGRKYLLATRDIWCGDRMISTPQLFALGLGTGIIELDLQLAGGPMWKENVSQRSIQAESITAFMVKMGDSAVQKAIVGEVERVVKEDIGLLLAYCTNQKTGLEPGWQQLPEALRRRFQLYPEANDSTKPIWAILMNQEFLDSIGKLDLHSAAYMRSTG